ncbi:hypothetical protein AGDE_16569 [Angomonas deanei]|nr:hypothetical protein AGDE_16569 [Angomonas deanei]|eukprot:EPY16868.1 hypothetical protein AGDE_16569 [Angomonas deanei]
MIHKAFLLHASRTVHLVAGNAASALGSGRLKHKWFIATCANIALTGRRGTPGAGFLSTGLLRASRSVQLVVIITGVALVFRVEHASLAIFRKAFLLRASSATHFVSGATRCASVVVTGRRGTLRTGCLGTCLHSTGRSLQLVVIVAHLALVLRVKYATLAIFH